MQKNIKTEYMTDEIANKTKPKLTFYTETEYEQIYNQWLTKTVNEENNGLWLQIEKYASKQQINSITEYINWKYYVDHPIIIRENDAGNHINIMREIGATNYISCSTFWVCLRRNAGKTTDGLIAWMLERYKKYGERGAYIRRRDCDLKEFLKEMKKEFFSTLEPMGFTFDKGAIIESETKETVISFRSLTGQVNSSSTFAHVNIMYDEPIAIKGDLILNERDLLMQLQMSLFRDKLPIGRLLLTSNANHLRTPLLEDLYLDYDSFEKNPKQIISTPFGSKIFMYMGFNIKPNRINSSFHKSPVGAFMDVQQHDFLENGHFAFTNHKYQWSIKSITITHYHAIYVLRTHNFIEATAVHKKTKEKRYVFLTTSQVKKEMSSLVMGGCPTYVFTNSDIVTHPEGIIIPDKEALISRWFRGIKADKYRFTSYILPLALQEILRCVTYGLLD